MRHLTLFSWAIPALLFSLGADASPAGKAPPRRRGQCRASTSLLSTTVAATSTSSLETPTFTEISISTTTTTEPETSSETSTTSSVTTLPADIATATSVAPDIPPTSTTSAAASEATSSSSTTESPAATSTAAPTPPPDTNVLKNGGFEDAGAWDIASPVSAPRYSYVLDDASQSHSGRVSASLNWAPRVPMDESVTFWFKQPINLVPNQQYAFSAWTKVSSLIPSCHVIYVIQSDDGSTQYKVLANFYQFTTTWAERTATWTNRVVTTAVFSVIADCGAPTTFKEGFSISFDDFSLKPI